MNALFLTCDVAVMRIPLPAAFDITQLNILMLPVLIQIGVDTVLLELQPSKILFSIVQVPVPLC